MYYANDNATDKIVSFYEKTVDSIYADPVSLLAEDIHSDLHCILEDEGFNMDDLEMMRDLAVIGEMIRAMLYRGIGDYHAYQDFLDQVRIAHVPADE